MRKLTPAQRIARFWAKADVRGDDECWPWLGYINEAGYGRAHQGGNTRPAARVAYIYTHGDPGAELDVDHLCRNPSCVNPHHLEAVPHRINMLRGDTIAARSASKTHCPRGHEYSEDNIYRTKQGHRVCRACRCEHDRRYRERKAAA